MKFSSFAFTITIFLGFPALAAPTAANQNSVVIESTAHRIDLADAAFVFEDTDGMLTLEDVRKPENRDRFQPRALTFGFSTSAYWLRFALNNPDSVAATRWLDTGNHTMQEVTLYAPDAQGNYQAQHTGSSLPFVQRPLPMANFVFPVTLLNNRTTVVYLRLQSYGFSKMNKSNVHPQIWTPDVYQKQAIDSRTAWFFYLGMAAALCLYNLVLFLAIRDQSYLLYVFSLVSFVLLIGSGAGGNGWGYLTFWPNFPILEQTAWFATLGLANWLPLLFCWHLLNVQNAAPRYYRSALTLLCALLLLYGFRALATALQIRLSEQWMEFTFTAGNGLIAMLCLIGLYTLVMLAWNKNRLARVVLLAWSPLSIAGFAAAVSSYTGKGVTTSLFMWASALELILMSLVLADRYNQERKAKASAQADLVSSLQQSERELEGKVAQRTHELQHEQARTTELLRKNQDLLHNMLPIKIAEELSATGTTRPIRHEAVTILFTDFSGFTQAASTMPPDRMVAELNAIFAGFDRITDECGVEKIKTIGDAYMAAAGVPTACDDHALRCVKAGLKMVAFLEQRNQTAAFKWSLRVGLHTGPVVAGVVGTRKFAFDIWGDTVNIASRMESSGEIGRVNISGYTYDLICEDYDCEYRGKVEAKGKGAMDMYFVRGILPKTKVGS